jgi:hypothetical protein
MKRRSLNRCHHCQERFSGSHAYGLHFHPSSGDCLPHEAMRAAGLELNTDGFWFVRVPLPEVQDG